MLFPLGRVDYERLKTWELFDVDTVTDLAAEIRSYYIPDFTDRANYNASFERLLKDLSASQ